MIKPIFAVFQDEKGTQNGAQKGNIRKKYKKKAYAAFKGGDADK